MFSLRKNRNLETENFTSGLGLMNTFSLVSSYASIASTLKTPFDGFKFIDFAALDRVEHPAVGMCELPSDHHEVSGYPKVEISPHHIGDTNTAK